MFIMNAINKTIIIIEKDLPAFSIADCAAVCPKYGSITAAVKLNLSFKPANIGLKLLTNPLAATLSIKYPTVAFTNPANAS